MENIMELSTSLVTHDVEKKNVFVNIATNILLSFSSIKVFSHLEYIFLLPID